MTAESKRTVTISGGFHSYLLGRRHVSESTARDYERAIVRVERFCGLSRFEINTPALEEFLSNGASWSTKNQSLVAFRLFHRWGVRRGYCTPDLELEELRLPRRRYALTLPLTAPEAQALLRAASSPCQIRLTHLGLYAGLRFEEIRSVSPTTWVVGVAGTQQLRVWGKGSVYREVPVHPELERVREQILERDCTRRNLLTAVTQLRTRLDIPYMTSRTLRRTFAEALSEAGVEREVVGGLLGHSPSGITATHYAPVRTREKTEAISCLHY